ncbi:hypothetical protein VXN63_08795 [Marinilactibacillus sp. XAAS-LB27]|uniref:hypothetical protein n=1 Tax=Marinilactibacillus sp. XAAS-LB27 TaxID=3114538 RepID=UPI002E1895EC|nr:hypothetical protein [Marinilactibacillus sp. XAAS-LB27]
MTVKKNNLSIIGRIVLIAILLILPQLVMKSMVIGSDSMFHFNRFWDTASQIKNGNFQYFIQMYGFQQTGRIVNALYGPFMAYFHGLLVLISPSWFIYQLLSNFILYVIAGLSMYGLLIASSIKKDIAFYTSVFFMTTFSITYWITRQGFTSWGAALLPICLLPIIQFEKNNKFNAFQVGFLVALMTQVHMFTALLLVIIYFIYFLNLFFRNNTNKLRLLVSLCYSISFFLLLTLNIWYSFLTIYKENNIVPPFINKTMYLNTITSNSSYWLTTPFPLVLLIGLKLYYDIKSWKNYGSFDKVTSLLTLFFLLLTTNIVPWKFLSTNHLLGVNFIQFPFRFFVPFTVLLLFSTAKNLNHHSTFSKKKKWFRLLLSFSLIQTIGLIIFASLQWNSNEPIKPSLHQFLYTDDSSVLKQSFYSKDKLLSLELVQKSTPDYLPTYHEDQSNKYELYEEYILAETNQFDKKIENHSLVVTWEGDSLEERNIPVVVYRDTVITHNGEQLTGKDIQLSGIGTPKLVDKEGENTLKVTYKESRIFSILLATTVLTWLISISMILFKFIGRIRKV